MQLAPCWSGSLGAATYRRQQHLRHVYDLNIFVGTGF